MNQIGPGCRRSLPISLTTSRTYTRRTRRSCPCLCPRRADTRGSLVAEIRDLPPPTATETQLLNRLQALAGELATASAPMAPLLTNALNIYAARARQGDGQAKEILRQLFLALDDARAALSSIEVPRGKVL